MRRASVQPRCDRKRQLRPLQVVGEGKALLRERSLVHRASIPLHAPPIGSEIPANRPKSDRLRFRRIVRWAFAPGAESRQKAPLNLHRLNRPIHRGCNPHEPCRPFDLRKLRNSWCVDHSCSARLSELSGLSACNQQQAPRHFGKKRGPCFRKGPARDKSRGGTRDLAGGASYWQASPTPL